MSLASRLPSGRRRAAGARRGLRTALVAAAAVASLVLSACTPAAQAPSDSATGSDSASAGASATPSLPAAPAGLESFYSQEVNWSSCDGGFECATISAPLDYDKPAGESIKLALIRSSQAAADKRIGSLVLNPGGPGGSGVSYLKQGGGMVVSANTKAAYDLVSFDPRGVGQSTAVRCLSGEQRDQQRASAEVADTLPKAEAALKQAKTYAQACAANSPAGLLEHVDTESSARDLDLIRSVLGDAQLHYLGFSYGTKLGARYAELFPSNVGRLVLDGAMDPSLDSVAVGEGQAKAFERALDLYLDACIQGDSCAFGDGTETARDELKQWVLHLESEPMPLADGRVLNAFDAVQALLLALYEPTLAARVNDAMALAVVDGDATDLMDLADLSMERSEDGNYANTNDAFMAINCVDYSQGDGKPETTLARGKDAESKAAFFGRYLGYDDGCSQWSVKSTHQPAPVKAAADLPPILVVGTTGDPATPYAWSEALQKQLPNSGLLTWEGEGHTAYGRSNECVVKNVDNYLLRGELPASDAARC